MHFKYMLDISHWIFKKNRLDYILRTAIQPY
jgi:hypothetical protein